MGFLVVKHSFGPKLYFLDIGLVCCLTGIKDEDHLLKGPLSGALFENFCVQETVKMFFHRGSIRSPERRPLRDNTPGLSVRHQKIGFSAPDRQIEPLFEK